MSLSNKEEKDKVEDDLEDWPSWTYKILHEKYKKYMSDEYSAGVLLRSRLQYHTKRKCLASCCGHDPPERYTCPDDMDAKTFYIEIGRLLTRLLKEESYDDYKVIKEDEPITIRDVIIWSVIINKRDYVIILLEKNKNHTNGTCIYAVLFASSIFKILSKLANAEENMELGSSFMENSRFFEALACKSVAHMYEENRAKAQTLLTQPVKEYGCSMKTPMQISKNNELMQFMGTTACQTKLKSIWREHMSISTSREMILTCIFLPFLIPRIKFVAHKSGKQSYHKQPFLRINWFGCTDLSKDNIGVIQAMYWFYSAPVTKFWTNLISYFVMLCCFSFFVLTDVHPIADGQISLTECCIFLWILTLFLEELRQICQREQRLLLHRLSSWWTDNWNKFDAIMYILFLLSVILRFSLQKDNFLWAQMTYSITLAFFILRTLQFFYVAKNTGPKIIMIGKMVTVLQFFIMIFAVVLVSFGIITQVNLYPNSEPTWQLLRNVVYLPYWQMFGELFLETISGREPSTCTTEPSIYRNGTLPRCPETTILVPLVLAVYMVLTNLMLLNLLIAMFSNTFQKVQDNSVFIWKFHRYSLVHEYYERPVLAPPLIIFNHLYRTIIFVKQKLNNKKDKPDKAFERNIPEEEIESVGQSERKAINICLTSLDGRHRLIEPRVRSGYQVSNADLDSKLNEIAELCDRVHQKLDEISQTGK